MIADSRPDAPRAIRLEARAHYLRMAMLSDAEFLAGIQEGHEEMERGERISLADLKRELGLG